jgi:hypothetical protein
MKKIYLLSVFLVLFKGVYSQTNENYQYVQDLPPTTVVAPTKLPETNLAKSFAEFKNTIPQYTKVNSNTAHQEETLEQAMDRLNNTPSNVNYEPNPLAPVTVPIDISEYRDVELSLADIQSGQLKEIVANKRREKLTDEIKGVANSPIGKITISLFQFCIYILCISVSIIIVILITNQGNKSNKIVK